MIEDIDIKILKEFNKLKEREETSSWKIMRNLFPKGNKREHLRLKYRIERMSDMGLFIIEKQSPRRFIMNKDNVIFKKVSCPNNPHERLGAVCLKIYSKWEIFEI